MSQSYPVIDYEDMLDDLYDDLESEYIDDTDTVFIVRQKTPVMCEAYGGEVCPVIDYFYDKPLLLEKLQELTVSDCKKLCFTALEVFDESGDESLKAAVSLIVQDLKEYTAGSPKRNDRKCKVVCEKETCAPLMVYFDDTDAGDIVEAVTVSDLIEELQKSSGS
ncbi:MAG: hypothetical protein J6127_02015 [Clostridiales bacterium]|nr:hypothetical protein [Clostridiales bacterium]